jgi:hypothetical protein
MEPQWTIQMKERLGPPVLALRSEMMIIICTCCLIAAWRDEPQQQLLKRNLIRSTGNQLCHLFVTALLFEGED